jgi:hypothetical protein
MGAGLVVEHAFKPVIVPPPLERFVFREPTARYLRTSQATTGPALPVPYLATRTLEAGRNIALTVTPRVTGELADLIPDSVYPAFLAVIPRQPAPKRRKIGQSLTEGDPLASFQHPGGSFYVFPNADQEDPVPGLWNTVIFGADQKLVASKASGRVIPPEDDLGINERVDAIARTVAVAPEGFVGIHQVFQNSVKDAFATDPGGKNPLHVLHDKDGRAIVLDQLEVFTIKKMPLVFLGHISGDTAIPGTTDKRVRLARRAADQNTICAVELSFVKLAGKPPVIVRVTERDTQRFVAGLFPYISGSARIWDGRVPLNVPVIVV